MTAAMRTVSLALSRFFPRQAVRRTVCASTTSLLASPGSPDRTTEMPRSALAVEAHENWLEQHRYLNMDDLREHKKEGLRHGSLVSPLGQLLVPPAINP